MPFSIRPLNASGVLWIEPRRFTDTRGFFMETYRRSEFLAAGIPEFVQDNHSRSARGTLRGLHFQRAPRAQGKLVRVLSGEVFDVAVDLREGTPTHGACHTTRLGGESDAMLYIPPWCAHGFCVLSDFADVSYKVTAEYDRNAEGGVRWDDPDLAIPWPVDAPRLSERDQRWPGLSDAAAGFGPGGAGG